MHNNCNIGRYKFKVLTALLPGKSARVNHGQAEIILSLCCKSDVSLGQTFFFTLSHSCASYDLVKVGKERIMF